MTAMEFKEVMLTLADALERLERYEALLAKAVAIENGTVFVCKKCGLYAVRERANRRLCEECGR